MTKKTMIAILVAAGHGGKKETPPEPESASEAGK